MGILADITSLLLPRLCPVCHCRLEHSERSICIVCATSLPRVVLTSIEDNVMLRMMWAYVPVEYAFSLLSYRHSSPFHSLLMRIKYQGDMELAYCLGEWVGEEALRAGLSDKIDILVPVPLDKVRERKRGYNQARLLAKGIGKVMGKPVVELLVRTKSGVSQTHLSARERLLNAQDIYQVSALQECKGMRVALVDDVMTTGATMVQCAKVLLLTDDSMHVGVLTLAFAGT